MKKRFTGSWDKTRKRFIITDNDTGAEVMDLDKPNKAILKHLNKEAKEKENAPPPMLLNNGPRVLALFSRTEIREAKTMASAYRSLRHPMDLRILVGVKPPLYTLRGYDLVLIDSRLAHDDGFKPMMANIWGVVPKDKVTVAIFGAYFNKKNYANGILLIDTLSLKGGLFMLALDVLSGVRVPYVDEIPYGSKLREYKPDETRLMDANVKWTMGKDEMEDCTRYGEGMMDISRKMGAGQQTRIIKLDEDDRWPRNGGFGRYGLEAMMD